MLCYVCYNENWKIKYLKIYPLFIWLILAVALWVSLFWYSQSRLLMYTVNEKSILDEFIMTSMIFLMKMENSNWISNGLKGCNDFQFWHWYFNLFQSISWKCCSLTKIDNYIRGSAKEERSGKQDKKRGGLKIYINYCQFNYSIMNLMCIVHKIITFY